MTTYYCIGCGKEHTADDVFPDNQWVCTNCRKNKIPIFLKCTVCGRKFPVQFETYMINKDKSDWRCRACNDAYRKALYDAKPQSDKDNFVEKQKARIKKYYQSLENDPEKKLKNKENRKKGWEKRREDGTAEHCLEAMKEGRAKWYESLSEEEKLEYWLGREKGRSEWWNSLTKEEQDKHMQAARDGISKYVANLSEEEYIAHFANLRNANKEYWDNMTPEKYIQEKVEFAKNIRKKKDNDPTVSLSIQSTPTEIEFANMLNIAKINHIMQYPSIEVHPEFRTRFTKNPATGSDLVDPTHLWDFFVKTNKGNVFIDIDGSVHKNNPFVISNDTKRPYQTDGLDAYVIQAYDDTIGPDNTVVNIKTEEQTTVSGLIALLKAMNNDKL